MLIPPSRLAMERAPGVGLRGARRILEQRPVRIGLAVADINWFSTGHLFRGLADPEIRSLLLSCRDYRNAWQNQRGASPSADPTGRIEVRELTLPPGWMKLYPRLGMKPLERAIRAWRGRQAPNAPLGLVMTYPYYLHLSRTLRPNFQVYFNLDDYSQYWPSRADEVRKLEREAVLQSELTVCVSLFRTEQLRAAIPEAAGRIRHLPHGAPEQGMTAEPLHLPAAAPTDLAHLPRPFLGYFGSLEDRIDWELLDRLAERFPAASLVLVGGLPKTKARSEAARRCLARPNVHAIGWRTQAQMRDYNAAFDVCLIPYRSDHPFNLACCPTKIMDYMATGRPIVSTDLPECRRYRHLFAVANDHDEFLAEVGKVLESNSDDGRAGLRHAYAHDHSCQRVVAQLVDWLPR